MKSLTALIALISVSMLKADLHHAYLSSAGDEAGIYLLKFDSETGSLTSSRRVIQGPNPQFLGIRNASNHLYAVSKSASAGDGADLITSYSIQEDNGNLIEIDSANTQGRLPIHFTLSNSGDFAVIAHYLSPTVTSLSLAPDGSLGSVQSPLSLEGSSIHPHRQDHSYPHSITLHPSGKFAYVCDRGSDRIGVFDVDPESRALKWNAQKYASARPGAGPRHMAFSKDGTAAFVVNEINGSVTVYFIDLENGSLKEGPSYPTLPSDFHDTNYSAEIAVHPNLNVLYASNRGHDSIAVFKIHDNNQLERLQIVPSGGEHPRYFALDPSGRWMLVSNRHSDKITVFAISNETGELVPSEIHLQIQEPLHLVFRQ